MKKILAIITLATAVSLSALPACAQQGSNQSTDYALSWGAVGGRGSTNGTSYARSYARYGHVHHRHAHRQALRR